MAQYIISYEDTQKADLTAERNSLEGVKKTHKYVAICVAAAILLCGIIWGFHQMAGVGTISQYHEFITSSEEYLDTISPVKKYEITVFGGKIYFADQTWRACDDETKDHAVRQLSKNLNIIRSGVGVKSNNLYEVTFYNHYGYKVAKYYKDGSIKYFEE